MGGKRKEGRVCVWGWGKEGRRRRRRRREGRKLRMLLLFSLLSEKKKSEDGEELPRKNPIPPRGKVASA